MLESSMSGIWIVMALFGIGILALVGLGVWALCKIGAMVWRKVKGD